MPGSKHAWPNSAACWSPAMPLIGDAVDAGDAARGDAEPPARRPHLGQRGHRHAEQVAQLGRPRRATGCRTASCATRWRLRWRARRRPVRFHSSHESTVPKARSGSASTPPSRSSHSSLVAEKYGSSTRPVVSRTSGRCPASRSSSQRAAVRRSCHTMARCSGAPVDARPHDDGLALVGDADGRHRLLERRAQLAEHLDDRGPDLVGVVLDPTRPREVLGELAVRPARRRALLVEGEGAHAGGPGIDGDDDAHGRAGYA